VGTLLGLLANVILSIDTFEMGSSDPLDDISSEEGLEVEVDVDVDVDVDEVVEEVGGGVGVDLFRLMDVTRTDSYV